VYAETSPRAHNDSESKQLVSKQAFPDEATADEKSGERSLRTFSNVAVAVTEKSAAEHVDDAEAESSGPSAAFFPTGVPWIINPKSAYMRKWDVVMLLLLLFTALITPYEVAFMATHLNFLFIVNKLVDVLFLKVRGCRASHKRWIVRVHC